MWRRKAHNFLHKHPTRERQMNSGLGHAAIGLKLTILTWMWRLSQICLSNSTGEVKVKVILWRAYTDTDGRWMCSFNPNATLALKAGGRSAPVSCHFTRRKDPVPFVQEAGWASGAVWKAHKISPSSGFDHRFVQPAASCCTDDDIPTATRKVVG